MKTTFCLLILGTTLANAADLSVSKGTSTIRVNNCAKGEMGTISISHSMTGEHVLKAECTPVYCVYENESRFPFNYHTKWTISLGAKTPPPATSQPEANQAESWWIYPNSSILNKGVSSKAERDALLHKYLDQKICKKTFYKVNSNAVSLV